MNANILWPADKVRRHSVAALIPYARNSRTHSAEQISQIAASIREFGFTVPVLIDERGGIIAGHARVLAAKQLGLAEVPAMTAAGWSDEQKRAYVIADNKLALNSSWDMGILEAELAALQDVSFDLSLTGFGEMELKGLLPLDDDGGDETDENIPAPPREPVTRVGDLWRLGDHRLLCGDSADKAIVMRVMGGERAALLFTSPPYGNQRDYTTGGVSNWDALMAGVFGAMGDAMHECGQVLVNIGMVHRQSEWLPYWMRWLDAMRAMGWRRFGLYVWDQGPGMPGDWCGRLAPSFEFLFHFNRAIRKPNKIMPCSSDGQCSHRVDGGFRHKDGHIGGWGHAGQHRQETKIPDSVIRIMRQKGRPDGAQHPAIFPVALPEFIMHAYTDEGAIVLDPFAGSGTSIIAGERAGRRVCALEIAPGYVDVAIQRWRHLHPEIAVMLDDGRAFDDVARERGINQQKADE